MESVSFFLINILLPIAGIVALVFLSIVFYNIIITIKGVHPLIDDVSYKMNVLNIPLNAIVKVNDSWNNFGKKFSKSYSKHRIKKKTKKTTMDDEF